MILRPTSKSRRFIALTFLLGTIFASRLFSQSAQTHLTGLPPPDRFLEITTIPLWEGNVPGAVGKEVTDVPTLTVFKPWGTTGNGTAVVIAPGGGYLGLAGNLEGRQVADWFTSRGVTAFVLKYRLGKKYLFPVPLNDAQRAIRLVRSRAKEFEIIPDRLGMIGFSAGGHLTASAGTMFDLGNPNAPDVVDRMSSRPDFIILGYPWVNAMKPGQKGAVNYCSLIAPDKCKSLEQYSPDEHVTPQTPPTFIYHTTTDELVPVDASVTFYRALHAAGIPVEMHIFEKGSHGTGLGIGDPALDLWPTLLEAWLRGRGLLTMDPGLVAERKKAAAPPVPRKPGEPFTVDIALRELLANPETKAIVLKHLGQDYVTGLPAMFQTFSPRQLLQNEPEKVQAIQSDLSKVAKPN